MTSRERPPDAARPLREASEARSWGAHSPASPFPHAGRLAPGGYLPAGLFLLACLLVAGLASIRAGQDASWDLLNYHLYNAWAWKSGRYGFDIAPAQMQSFHNPLADLPLQAMIDAQWPPRLIAFAMGLPTGFAAFFLFVIASALLRAHPLPLRITFATFGVVIGMTGANATALLGTATGDWVSAAAILAGIAVLVRKLPDGPLPLRTLAVAGACAGLACALKLAVAPFALAMALALLARRDVVAGLRDCVVFGVAAGAMLGILSAPWMLLMQQHYGSAMFPYFNSVFGSPLVERDILLDRRFGATSVAGWLRFPLDLVRPRPGLVSELPHRDPRITLALVAIAVCIGAALLRSRGDARLRTAPGAGFRFLAIFFVIGFAVWAGLYAIYRYTLPLETTSGVIIVTVIASLRRVSIALVLATVTTFGIARHTQPSDWGRVPYASRFHQIEPPRLEPGAMVLLSTPEPMSYVLPALDPGARHVGIHSNLVDPQRPNGLQRQVAEAVRLHHGPLYQLTPRTAPTEGTLAAYGLARVPGGCAPIVSNLAHLPLELCRLERRSIPGARQGPSS